MKQFTMASVAAVFVSAIFFVVAPANAQVFNFNNNEVGANQNVSQFNNQMNYQMQFASPTALADPFVTANGGQGGMGGIGMGGMGGTGVGGEGYGSYAPYTSYKTTPPGRRP